MRILLALLLSLTLSSAWAVPIVFDDVQYATTALAELGADLDQAADGAAPPDALPVQSNAALDGVDEHAYADGIADEFLLATVVDLMSVSEAASAVATADFLGRFTAGGRQRLSLDFESLSDNLGGTAGAQLAVTLTVGLDTLLDQLFDVSTQFDFDFEVASALDGVLSLNLIGSGDAIDGRAFNLSTLSFALNSVPEPSSLALCVLAMGLLLSSRISSGAGWRSR